MKNRDLIIDFCNYKSREGKGSNLYIEGDVLFSYGYHYPLCIRLKEGFVLNSDGRSMSTQTHKNEVVRILTNCHNESELKKEKKEKNGAYRDIIFMNTQELNNFIRENGDNFQFISAEDLIKLKVIGSLRDGSR